MACVALCSCTSNMGKADFNVIPQPNNITVDSTATAHFILDKNVSIVHNGDEDMTRNARFLAQYIQEMTGIELSDGGDKVIKLQVGLNDENPEAYKLQVYPDSVVITGATPAAVFRALQTVRKSLPTTAVDAVEMPIAEIYDYPRFEYRGAHFDVCRHFYTIDEVKTFIDMLALHNVNNFHWHLNDDQGWRIEIKKYPKLVEIGSKRTETVIGRNPGKWDGVPVSGYYTQEQAKEIIEYATERYINVIPEIDMPGHMRSALAAYPHLGCTGGPYDVWTEWGVTPEVLCAGNDSTMTFLADVFNEIMDIFPSKYINAGGDECPKTRWQECPKCQARIKAEGIVAKGRFNEFDRLQGYVTNYIYKVISARGRMMMGWDEILQADIPSDAIVLSWQGIAGAIEGAKRGNKVVLSPNTHCYFDFYQSKDVQFEPFAIGGYTPVEKVYSFEPVPSELDEEQAKLVIGAQCNLWTEYIKTFSHVQYMELPRLAALCEVQWTEPEHKDYESFKERIPAMFAIYDKYGYNYAKHLCDVNATYTPNTEKKALEVTFSTLKNREIRYTTDGNEPDENSTLYSGPFTIDSDVIIKAASFSNGVKSRTICDTINTNIASFTKATFNTVPAIGYAFNGAQTLVDGIMGGTTNYRTGRWIGFVGNNCDVVIDLGSEQSISELGFNCCVFQCDGVVDAAGVEIYGSNDGKEYSLIASEEYPEVVKEMEFATPHHEIKFAPKSTRYLNVIIKSHKALPSWHAFAGAPAFVFVDEITVK